MLVVEAVDVGACWLDVAHLQLVLCSILLAEAKRRTMLYLLRIRRISCVFSSRMFCIFGSRVCIMFNIECFDRNINRAYNRECRTNSMSRPGSLDHVEYKVVLNMTMVPLEVPLPFRFPIFDLQVISQDWKNF